MASAQITQKDAAATLPEEETVTESRSRLRASADHLVRSAEFLAASPVDLVAGAGEALKSVRSAYEALLAWHNDMVGEDESLAEIARRAESAASMLRTSYKRALHLETVVATFTTNEGASITQRENAVTGYYTARNTLSIVIGSLPAHVVEESIPVVNRAESIRREREIPSMDRGVLSSRQPVYPTTRRPAQPVAGR